MWLYCDGVEYQCNFGLQLISDFFILNAKVMSTVDAEHIERGVGRNSNNLPIF